MLQHCQTCGHESQEADKFCANCGNPFGAETEFTSAPTMSQVNPGSNPVRAVPNTGRFSPSVGDVVAGDTQRYYYQPQYAPGPVNIGHAQEMAPPRPVPSLWLRAIGGFFKGLMLFVFIGALMAATGTAVFFSQEARRERERRYEIESKWGGGGGNLARGLAQDAWQQMEDAIRLSQQAAEKAAGAGATLSINNEKPGDLNKYAYPGAKVEAATGGSGNEAISLLTDKDLETVRTFYEAQFGKPVIQITEGSGEESRKKLLFQSATTPPVLVRVEDVEENQVKITILPSPLQFPKTGAAQSQK